MFIHTVPVLLKCLSFHSPAHIPVISTASAMLLSDYLHFMCSTYMYIYQWHVGETMRPLILKKQSHKQIHN